MRGCLLVWIALALLATVLAAGCTGEPVPTSTPDEPTAAQTQPRETLKPTRESTPMPTPSPEPRMQPAPTTAPSVTRTTPGALPAGAEPLVALAREDLARRLDLSPDAIRLLSVEAVEWPDAGLGCPQHRLLYPDVVTPGFRLVLEAEDQTYAYHTDSERLIVLCGEDGRPAYPVIPVDPDEIMDGEPWMPVD